MNTKQYMVNYPSLSEKIINYNNRRKNEVCSKEIEHEYREILFNLRLLIYLLPQVKFWLKEEDAAEFLLYMDPKIEGIVKNYTYKSENLLSYIGPIIIRKILTFKQKKYANEQKELAIIKYHAFYDTMLTELDNNDKLVAEEDEDFCQTPLRRLKFLCRNHLKTKKRFFVYLVSLSGLLSERTLRKICTYFNFDYEETYKIMNRIIEFAPDTDKNDIQKERRNMDYLRCLLEEMKAELDYDFSKNQQYPSKIDRYRNCACNHNKTIGNRRKTVGKTIIAHILGITPSYAGLASFYIRNILTFCLEEDFSKTSCSLGISTSLYDMLCDGSWEDCFEPDEEPYFSPFKVFNLKFSEQYNCSNT